MEIMSEYLGNSEYRKGRFRESALIPVSELQGYGILHKKTNTFIGFYTNKGLISIWNEARKAKLAFAYHTKNTLDERANDFEVIKINQTIKEEI